MSPILSAQPLGRPDVVCYPTAAQQVPAIVRAAARHGVPITARGEGTGWLADDFAGTGVIGDPTGATAELGAQMFAAKVDALVDAIPEIAVFDPGRVVRSAQRR